MISKRNIILVVASLGVFAEALDIAIINLAIPSVQSAFVLGSDKAQWLQTLYVVLYGGFLLIGGKLSDAFGRKRIFIAGCILFLLTSLGAGLAPSFNWLLFFRAVQGIGAALIMPSAFSIITHTFTEGHERGKAIGIFSSFAAIGSASGLSIGGLISSYWGWQWVFLINVPVLAIVIVLAGVILEDEARGRVKKMPDVLSGLLIVAIPLMLTYSIHLFEHPKENLLFIFSLLAGIAGCVKLLQARFSRQQEPVIDVSIFKLPSVIAGNGVFIILGAFFTAYLFILSLILQQSMHFSAARAGVLLVPFSIVSALTARYALPVIMKRMTIVHTAILGMACMFTGGLFMISSLLSGNSLPLLLCAAACVSGLGMCICFTSFSVIAIQHVPPKHYGLGSSLTTTCYFMGGGIGLSLVSLFMRKDDIHSSVSVPSVLALCFYGLIGLIGLIIYNRKRSVKQASIAEEPVEA